MTTGSSSFKLPSVDMKSYFPYLEGKGDSKMSAEQLSLLQVQLDEQTSKIKRTFASLVYDLQKYIDNENKMDELVIVLKFLKDKNIEDMLPSCLNTTEVFDKLSPYFSFFDFSIIKILTDKLGSDYNKGKLKKYRRMFKEFAKQRVCECPSDAFGDAKKSEKVFFVKKDEHITSLSLKELEKFKYNLCKVLKCDLRLLCIKDGCVELSFRVFGVDKIVISEEQRQDLKKLGVLKIQHGNEVIDLVISSVEEKAILGKVITVRTHQCHFHSANYCLSSG